MNQNGSTLVYHIIEHELRELRKAAALMLEHMLASMSIYSTYPLF